MRAEINQSNDHLLVVQVGTPTAIDAVWQNGQGNFTTASVQDYPSVMCDVLHAQNYRPGAILPVGINSVIPDITKSNC